MDKSQALLKLEDLGFLEDAYKRFAQSFRKPYGAILVTGPTGSGKSTTMYSTLNILNEVDKNIITVEDPVEYRLAGVNQIQVNPKAGLTFASALRSILRADPDIVLIGEIRDRETATIAIEAALTGHLVLSSLHTNDAPSAITRLTEMDVETFLVASAIDSVVAQRLARKLCERCKVAYKPEEAELVAAGFPEWLWPEITRDLQAAGLRSLREHRLPRPAGPLRGHADDRRDRTTDGRARVVGCDQGRRDAAGHDHPARRRPREGSHGRHVDRGSREGGEVTMSMAMQEERRPGPDPGAARRRCWTKEGSDLHLTAGAPPVVRVHGELERLEGYPALSPRALQGMIYAILPQKLRERFEQELELDMSYSLPGRARFRVNVYMQRDAIGAAFRVIPFEIKAIDDLGLPTVVADLARFQRGFVVVTGPTGSGKSTTLASMVDVVNTERHGSHHDRRGSDRVPAQAQELHREPARGRRRHARVLARRSSTCCARTPT